VSGAVAVTQSSDLLHLLLLLMLLALLLHVHWVVGSEGGEEAQRRVVIAAQQCIAAMCGVVRRRELSCMSDSRALDEPGNVLRAMFSDGPIAARHTRESPWQPRMLGIHGS